MVHIVCFQLNEKSPINKEWENIILAHRHGGRGKGECSLVRTGFTAVRNTNDYGTIYEHANGH